MPRFTDFGEYFRNHRIMFWLYIVDRGKAVLMRKDDNPFTKDPWHLKDNEFIYAAAMKRKKVIDLFTEDKIRILQKTINYVSVIEFEDMPKNIKKIYLAGKKVRAYDDLDITGNVSLGTLAYKYRTAIVGMMHHLLKNKVSYRELSEMTGLTTNALRYTIDNSSINSNDTTSSIITKNQEKKMIDEVELNKSADLLSK